MTPIARFLSPPGIATWLLTLAFALLLAGCGGSSSEPAPNRAPVAVAGPAQTVTVGTPVTLDGSASHDPDGHVLGFAWRITAAPAGSIAALDNSAAMLPVITPDLPGSYTLSLVVGDGTLDSAPATTTVTATPPDPGGPVQIVLDQLEPVSGVVVFTLSHPHPGPVSWYVDLQLLGPPQGSEHAMMSWDSTTAAVGPHLVTAHLHDGQGGWQEVRRTIEVGPGPITVLVRVRGASGTIAVDVGASSPHGIQSVSATLDGQALGTLTEPNGCGPVIEGNCQLPYTGWLFTLDAAVIGPGPHQMRITATDNAGRTQTLVQAVQVGPVITLALPRPDSIVYGSLSVAGSVQAVPTTAVSVTVLLGGTPVLSATRPEFAGSYDLTGVAPGPQRLVVRATDATGLVTELERHIVVAASPGQVRAPALYLPESCQNVLVGDGVVLCWSPDSSTAFMHDVPGGTPATAVGTAWTPLALGRPASRFSEWFASDGGVQAVGPGDDCYSEIGRCVYRWNNAGERLNLTRLQPNYVPGRLYESHGLKAHGGYLLWHQQSGTTGSDQLVLYDVAQASYMAGLPYAFASHIGLGNTSDFAVRADGVVFVYIASRGEWNNVYEWRSDTQASRCLTECISQPAEGDLLWRYVEVKTDGRRLGWLRSLYRRPSSEYSGRFELGAMTLDSGAAETLLSRAGAINVSFTLVDSVLTWLDGGVKASADGAIHTSPIGSKVLANGSGRVAVSDNQGTYTWNPVTGQWVQHITAPVAINMTGGHVVFVYRSALYRLPLP